MRVVTQPFFLSVGFHNTHRPFGTIDPADDPRYCLPPAPLPDAPETRQDFAAFKSAVRELDQLMGLVLNALDTSGLSDKTLVICTTDHGIAFPHMKGNLTGHGTAVMLIMRGPGGFTGGKVLDALVSQIDLFPTLCELLELDPPSWLEGRSLMPLIRSEVDQINDAVFSELTYHAAYEPMRAVRTNRWNYIRRFSSRERPVLSNCDDGPSKDLLVRNGWGDTSLPQEELYDLVFDPVEAHNIAAQEGSEAVLQEMRQRLSAWMRQTNDPLCDGPVCPPAQAPQNNPDSLSPDEPLKVFSPADPQWHFSEVTR
jgi:arylsulfatase A-like enzyme